MNRKQQREEISRIQVITQSASIDGHLSMLRNVCQAGVDWVQLRIKDESEADVLKAAWQAIEICSEYGARLIINDYPHIALAVSAHGVHLGSKDMDPRHARDLLGDDFVIGATANTIEDIEGLQGAEIDYIGLGPYRFTETKKALSPVLGLKGVRRVLIQHQLKGFETPIISVGGIQVEDVRDLLHAGAHGVAISGLLARSLRQSELIEQLLKIAREFPDVKKYGAADRRRKNF
jgi:thiamine-phosphate pyrophosphorylase